MNIWRLVTHHTDPDAMLSWIRQNQRIAIGWGSIGDIEANAYHSAGAIGAAIRQHYPSSRNSGLGGPSLWNLYDELKNDDFVILSTIKRRVLVVEIKRDYEYVAQKPPFRGEYQHQRRIKITQIDPEKLWQAAGAAPAAGQNIRYTLMKCADSVSEDSL